ncbi:hypothetical protein OFK41_07485 [Acinetobacter baumannii]|uniref:hypothetical protein n=1 Tax=Acinetobacter baumannii TaxID=470 RepID=UPI00225A819A|nr:hypothetical protein [Acinetobacter baumannii]MCX3034047.1 hypothetical protein [Acinetobacter baumannii]
MRKFLKFRVLLQFMVLISLCIYSFKKDYLLHPYLDIDKNIGVYNLFEIGTLAFVIEQLITIIILKKNCSSFFIGCFTGVIIFYYIGTYIFKIENLLLIDKLVSQKPLVNSIYSPYFIFISILLLLITLIPNKLLNKVKASL